MKIQSRVGLTVAGTALFAGVIVFAAHGWLTEHDARMKAEAQTGQQQRQIDSLKQQQASTQEALDTKLAFLDQQRKRPETATQLISDTAALLPALPEAFRIRSSPEDPALPNGPSTQAVVVPEADFKSIRDAQLTCEENALKLTACQEIQENSKQQLKLTEAQRDEWKKTAKGGSIWRRAASAAKWFAAGAGTGAVAYAVAHHK